MASRARKSVEERVVEAAEAALAEKGHVSAIDVLVGMGWLQGSAVDRWRQGRVPHLEAIIEANLSKISKAMRSFRMWARRRGLKPSETSYVARTRDRHPLQFSKSGDPAIERNYRTHWVSPKLSEQKQRRLAERANRPLDLVVISPLKDWSCESCGGTGDLLIMEGPGPFCLVCADMDHLVFLSSGDAALTRRARKASRLSAVVVRFSRSRKRYERQGLLVEETALEEAEAQCLADETVRERRRQREAARRLIEDQELQGAIAAEISRLFPGCPSERAEAISRHTAARGSGRIGRTAAARDLDLHSIELAVAASVRHRDTDYDDMLMSGIDRDEARARVHPDLVRILDLWRRLDP